MLSIASGVFGMVVTILFPVIGILLQPFVSIAVVDIGVAFFVAFVGDAFVTALTCFFSAADLAVRQSWIGKEIFITVRASFFFSWCHDGRDKGQFGIFLLIPTCHVNRDAGKSLWPAGARYPQAVDKGLVKVPCPQPVDIAQTTNF